MIRVNRYESVFVKKRLKNTKQNDKILQGYDLDGGICGAFGPQRKHSTKNILVLFAVFLCVTQPFFPKGSGSGSF